jgi:hypothetical protein
MILLREFNEENKIDKIWYNSSMIIYSECYDDPNTPLKELSVTFKNGATYKYLDVDVNDYVMFVHGGLDDSNGKALNKYIKPKYECIREENKDVNLLKEELENRLKKYHKMTLKNYLLYRLKLYND